MPNYRLNLNLLKLILCKDNTALGESIPTPRDGKTRGWIELGRDSAGVEAGTQQRVIGGNIGEVYKSNLNILKFNCCYELYD